MVLGGVKVLWRSVTISWLAWSVIYLSIFFLSFVNCISTPLVLLCDFQSAPNMLYEYTDYKYVKLMFLAWIQLVVVNVNKCKQHTRCRSSTRFVWAMQCDFWWKFLPYSLLFFIPSNLVFTSPRYFFLLQVHQAQMHVRRWGEDVDNDDHYQQLGYYFNNIYARLHKIPFLA